MAVKKNTKQESRGWRPQNPGDAVAGEVIDASARDGGFGTYVVLTIRRDDGAETDIHCFHSVLQAELRKKAVQIGDHITITYLGARWG